MKNPTTCRTGRAQLAVAAAMIALAWSACSRDAHHDDAGPPPQGAPMVTPRPEPAPAVGAASAAGEARTVSGSASADADGAAGGAGGARTLAAAPGVQSLPPANPDPSMTQDPSVEGLDDRGGAYARVGFSTLAGYFYDVEEIEATIPDNPDGKPEDHIPPAVRALDGKKVVVRGFMMPIEMIRNETSVFLLVRNRLLCCFGMMVGINEWVHVRMADDKRVPWINDVPIAVYGTLRVREEVRDGMIMSLYRMEGEDVVHGGGY